MSVLLLLLLQLLLLLRRRAAGRRRLWRRRQTQQRAMRMTAMDQAPTTTIESIWRRLSDRLRQFVQSRGVAAPDADDIVQETFLRIHRRASDLSQIERLDAWVFQITRNAMTDHFRRPQKRAFEMNEDPVSPAEAADESVNVEVAECLVALIEQLPEDQREALRQYEFDGLSQRDIADRQSVSLSAAKSRIQRARQNLGRVLQECCQFELDRRGNLLDYQQVDGDCSCGSCGDE